MNPSKPSPEPEILQLQKELAAIRQASLIATRKGHYMAAAKLTVKASEINREIFNIKTQLGELRERVYGI